MKSLNYISIALLFPIFWPLLLNAQDDYGPPAGEKPDTVAFSIGRPGQAVRLSLY